MQPWNQPMHPGQNLQLKEGKNSRAHLSIQTTWSNLQQYVSGVCILLTKILKKNSQEALYVAFNFEPFQTPSKIKIRRKRRTELYIAKYH
jgi:hypothetical protein